MSRREFIAGLGSAASWPPAAFAQTRPSRIGALVIGNADVPAFQKELREGLGELGRTEGRDYVLELRSAERQLGRLPELAAELVRLKVNVIVALFTPCGLAARDATREIPIVIMTGDPLGTGLVDSLARPGGNVTGLSQMAPQTHLKCAELLHDMLPSARRIGLLATAADPLVSYQADTRRLFRRAAGFVDKILRGESPAEIPIEQPTNFELVINLKTAKALGMTIPESFLLRADEVIE